MNLFNIQWQCRKPFIVSSVDYGRGMSAKSTESIKMCFTFIEECHVIHNGGSSHCNKNE